MPFLAVAAAGSAVAKKISPGLFKKPSPRYHGGPLYSTANGFLSRVASGDVGALRQLDQLRRTDKDKKAWQALWDEYVPVQPLSESQRSFILQADPSKAGSLPAARTGAPVLANPGAAAPSPIELVTEPIRAAVVSATEQGEATIREGLAQSVERVGVGGAAAVSRELRGGSGPLDTLIQFSQKPGGLVIIVVGGVLAVALIARALR